MINLWTEEESPANDAGVPLDYSVQPQQLRRRRRRV